MISQPENQKKDCTEKHKKEKVSHKYHSFQADSNIATTDESV
jgi:hypothetical protein